MYFYGRRKFKKFSHVLASIRKTSNFLSYTWLNHHSIDFRLAPWIIIIYIYIYIYIHIYIYIYVYIIQQESKRKWVSFTFTLLNFSRGFRLNIFIVMEIRKELKSSLHQQHKFYDLVSLSTSEKNFLRKLSLATFHLDYLKPFLRRNS